MTTCRSLRYLAYGICALLTAACGDTFVETIAGQASFGSIALDTNHQGVIPVLGLAAAFLFALGLGIVRNHGSQRRDADWVIGLARDLRAAIWWKQVAAILGSAFGIVVAMEEYERGFGGASPFSTAGGSPSFALASAGAYVVFAVLIAHALALFARTLVATCEAVAACIAMLGAWLARCVATAGSYRARVRREISRHDACEELTLFGDRAPPKTA